MGHEHLICEARRCLELARERLELREQLKEVSGGGSGIYKGTRTIQYTTERCPMDTQPGWSCIWGVDTEPMDFGLCSFVQSTTCGDNPQLSGRPARWS